jgi:hypothetical protein
MDDSIRELAKSIINDAILTAAEKKEELFSLDLDLDDLADVILEARDDRADMLIDDQDVCDWCGGRGCNYCLMCSY